MAVILSIIINVFVLNQVPDIQRNLVEMAVIYEVDPYIALAIAHTESRFDPVQVSHTNDYGLMQLHCGRGFSWCRRFNISTELLFCPFMNTYFAMEIIKKCKQASKKSGRHWLWHYNKSSKYVRHICWKASRFKEVPQYAWVALLL